MALQAIMDGWSVRNGWVGSGDNKFLTKADLEGYLSDPANAAFLSQVTGASGGSGGSGSGNGGWPTTRSRSSRIGSKPPGCGRPCTQ